MARRTPRQKHVHSLLTGYWRIKRSQFRRRERRTPRKCPTNGHTDEGSDTPSVTTEPLSLSSPTPGSLSSLSLSTVGSGYFSPIQGDTGCRFRPHIPAPHSIGPGPDYNSFDSSSDSSSNSGQRSPPAKRRRVAHGLAHRVCKALATIYSNCYHMGRKPGRIKPPAHLPLILTTYKDQEEFHHLFRQHLRIDPITFDNILTEISTDPVFTNQSRHPQMAVDRQLAITLFRFGHYGNAASLQRVADWAGVGKGTVLVVTRRVMTAVLRSSFKDQAIRMPTPEEKEGAKQWVGQRSKCMAWRDGWCFVDGTLVPLAFWPFWYGQSYFDRKCQYSLNIQVIPMIRGFN